MCCAAFSTRGGGIDVLRSAAERQHGKIEATLADLKRNDEAFAAALELANQYGWQFEPPSSRAQSSYFVEHLFLDEVASLKRRRREFKF